MTRDAPILALVAGAALAPAAAFAQTCSCAAVPLLGSMQSFAADQGEWFLASTYEYHDITDLVAGSTVLPDTTGRERTATAFVLETSRGLTENWSLSLLLSTIEHRRSVGGETVVGNGLGDGILMAKWSPRRISLYSDSALSIGFGARVPLGDDDLSRDGVPLAEDMQPSTGANGGVAWAYWARALNDSASRQIYASASHGAYGANSRTYQFGDETILAFGSSWQTRSRWGFVADLSYRHARRDQRNSSEIPNTGGDWLDLNLGAQLRATEALGFGLGMTYPLRRELNDELQFSTSYALRASFSFVFGGQP